MNTAAITRRHLIAGAALTPFLLTGRSAMAQEPIEDFVIDLPGEPESIDPALAYSPRDWSIVHSIYDALVQFDSEGNLIPLAAETFETKDATSFSVTLRQGLRFHDGTPVTSDAIRRSVDYMQSSSSQMVEYFKAIARVDVHDERNATIVCAGPSPWLPAQLAAWIVLLPESATPETSLTAPIGSGPYRFESYEPGSQIVLTRNTDYTWASPKGAPLAERVTYRFVPEATTRVADLATGAAHLITEVPMDQIEPLESSGGNSRIDPIVGIGFIRIATDTRPFDDVRVRQALNHAIDSQTIATALIDPAVVRIATAFPDERAAGFDPDLAPYSYDPDRARALLGEAGYADGFSTQLEITSTARRDIAEAIVEQLGEVGIEVELVASEYATFNAGWADQSAPPLRMVTWSPLYEPYTFLGLIFISGGYLARYGSVDVDSAFTAASAEPNPAQRTELLQDVGRLLHDDAPAVWLWNLVASYGLTAEADAWTSRADEYVIATTVAP